MTPEAAEASVVEYAQSLPSKMLCAEFIDTVERALHINNSGAFKIAAIFMDELDRRGYGDLKFRAFRDLIRYAVANAEGAKPDPGLLDRIRAQL